MLDWSWVKNKPWTQKIFNILWDLEKRLLRTLMKLGRRLKFLAKHINLDNTELVREFIANSKYSNGYKDILVNPVKALAKASKY